MSRTKNLLLLVVAVAMVLSLNAPLIAAEATDDFPGIAAMIEDLDQKLDPEIAALIVLDIQNDFCAEGGYAQKRGDDLKAVTSLMPHVIELVDKARAAGVPVFFTQANYDYEVMQGNWREKYKKRGIIPDHCKTGSWGVELFKLEAQPGERIITKHVHSAFEDTDLEQALKTRDRKSLILCGAFTNICVQATAWQGFAKGYYLVFAQDALLATSPEQQKTCLENFQRTLGEVVTNEKIFESWAGKK